MVLTAIGGKFQVDETAANAARFGFETVSVFTDPTKAFAVLSMRLRDRRSATAGRERSAGTHRAAARARTLALVEPLTHEQLTPHIDTPMSPTAWPLAVVY